MYGGTIRIGKRDITKVPTHKIIHLGVSYMAQTNNVFPNLSIRENLVASGSDPDAAFKLFPALRAHKKKKASQLSGGLRQLLAMAMIVSKRPRVILFDEPTASLSPKNAHAILENIRSIQKKLDNCIILVEQNVHGALEYSDKVYLMASGAVVYSGDPKKLSSDSDLGKKYLGLDVK